VEENNKKFILDNYKFYSKKELSSILNERIVDIDLFIKGIDKNFEFSIIYKKELVDLYIRKNISLKYIAESLNCTQANLTKYMNKFNVYGIQSRYNRLKNHINEKNNITNFYKSYNKNLLRKDLSNLLKRNKLTIDILNKHHYKLYIRRVQSF